MLIIVFTRTRGRISEWGSFAAENHVFALVKGMAVAPYISLTYYIVLRQKAPLSSRTSIKVHK